MFLKRRTRRKDGKVHTYYSVCESLRVHHGRTVQRQLLHLGELNTTQLDSWQQTLAEAEAAFRTLKTDLKVRPIWHWTEPRVHAHLLVAFLGYCLWVYVKKCCQQVAPTLTPWAVPVQLGRIVLVEVWFELRSGGTLCLPRITQSGPAQAALLAQLHWCLPAQPPLRIYSAQIPALPE